MQNKSQNDPPLTADEVSRYSRHILLPEVGAIGQAKLKAARVAIIGAGGLGSPVTLYLAAAGVGTLGIVEFDHVDRTNLQRQILYVDRDVGRPKIEAAVDRLCALAPSLKVELFPDPLSANNAAEILANFDVVVDGTDNFATRYLVNDACVLLGKPNVYGSIFRFDGQASVFDATKGPCYRCLFPAPPPADQVPNCAEGGVLGVLPGLIGMMQATETLKQILDIGTSLVGRLLLIDALSMQFSEFKITKDPKCPSCGKDSRLKTSADLVNMHTLASSLACKHEPQTIPAQALAITPQELNTWREGQKPHQLIDVRSKNELQICRIEGSLHIPLPELPHRLGELDSTQPLVIYCKSGVRSAQAQAILKAERISNTFNLAGGILAWIDTIQPNMSRY